MARIVAGFVFLAFVVLADVRAKILRGVVTDASGSVVGNAEVGALRFKAPGSVEHIHAHR
jgi:hypothetical protein